MNNNQNGSVRLKTGIYDPESSSEEQEIPELGYVLMINHDPTTGFMHRLIPRFHLVIEDRYQFIKEYRDHTGFVFPIVADDNVSTLDGVIKNIASSQRPTNRINYKVPDEIKNVNWQPQFFIDLSKATKWPIYGFYSAYIEDKKYPDDKRDDGIEEAPLGWAVKTPTGLFIDEDGVYSLMDIFVKYKNIIMADRESDGNDPENTVVFRRLDYRLGETESYHPFEDIGTTDFSLIVKAEHFGREHIQNILKIQF